MSESKTYSCVIIEDDPVFAKLLAKVVNRIPDLKLVGSYSDTVSSAMNVLRVKPEIIFLDINIHGLEGPEMLHLIDYQPETIVISSHPPDIMNDYNIEYTAFIQKPLKSSEQLHEAIEKCIGNIEKSA